MVRPEKELSLLLEWTPIAMWDTSLQLVARSIYRAFVGQPVCKPIRLAKSNIRS